MKYKSALTTQASGSLRGITASHNRGGQYLRGRVIPTNPSTTRQVAVRTGLRAAVTAWTLLSAANRSGWTVYAGNTPVTNTLGDPITLTGQQMFIRQYVSRQQASLTPLSTAPGIFDLGTFTAPTLTLTASSTTLSVAFLNSDLWAIGGTTATGSAMLVYASSPQNPSINFFKGPFQLVGKIQGTTSPAAMTLPFAAGPTGTKTFYNVVVTGSDGRLTTQLLGAAVAP